MEPEMTDIKVKAPSMTHSRAGALKRRLKIIRKDIRSEGYRERDRDREREDGRRINTIQDTH